AGRTIDAELSARCIHGHLGHEPKRRRLAAGDRDEPLDAVSLAVVDKRVRPRYLPGVRDFLEGEEWARPCPDAERPCLTEARDELLALVEHLSDLGLRDLELVGIAALRVRLPAHHACPDA